ncbi:MAG TPA: EAL domain-containing protein [Desulfuromonadales bacterium]|nr:EAL domain-containing protein [Desulfuromonadales bacterium]
MKTSRQDNPAWVDTLSDIVREAGAPLRNTSFEKLDDCCVRVAIVARIRWIMLAMMALFAVVAATSYSFSAVGYCFSVQQTIFLLLSVVSVIIYNVVLSARCSSLSRFPYLIHLQIGLDLFFVTVLVHFTGGVVSWFWPVYLLISLESAFLFDDKRDVWLIGTLGAALYGALLAAESVHLIPTVLMPFVNSSQYAAALFQLLMWCWVAGMNATVAFIAAFLMDNIRKDKRRVKESEDALLSFISSAGDLIFCVDQTGMLLYTNHSFANLICVDSTISQQTIFDLVSSETRPFLRTAFVRIFDTGQPENIEVLFSTIDQQTVDVEMSLKTGVSASGSTVVWGVCRDITERKRIQEELHSLAHHDNLTGLPNRTLLEDRLKQAKAISNRFKTGFAVIFLDLDRFKIINDTLGHSVGDELLRLVAIRLKSALRETDTIARIGGDEFILLLAHSCSRSDVSSLAEKILKALQLPFHLLSHELFVTASLGGCIYPDDETDIESMMKKADIAMYHAKSQGRNNFQFYNNQMNQNSTRRFVISNSLRRGLEQNEFRLYYQPKVDVTSGRIVAMEALVRWQHPELGLLSPMEFIQLAEENGLIVQLGEWVLREACLQNKRWQDEEGCGLRVAVNVSGYQLQHKQFLPLVRNILEDTGIAADHLEFEITESVIMQNPDFAVTILTEISSLGIHISIDDFGTGYSSLAHLKRFSINTLKIDKSFVQDVDFSSTDAAIASAIIAMGNSLNLNVIAEGVETQAQYDFLKDNNCSQVQGFLFGHPLPSGEFLKLLRQNRLDF